MESNINWLHLPDIVWELILSNLRTKCLLRASESCKKFNYLLSDSKRLMDKISLRLWNKYESRFYRYHPKKLKTNEGCLDELKLLKECLENSARKYDGIIINNLGSATENNMMDVIFEILELDCISGSVKQITFCNTLLEDNSFYKIIQIMKNLKVLKFEEYCDPIDTEAVSEIIRPDIVSSINEIHIIQCRSISFQKLMLFDSLTILKVDIYDLKDGSFENFLLMQKELKVLHLFNLDGIFDTDLLTNNIKFTLDELSLNKVDWENDENAMKFFKTQTNLKKITLNEEYLYIISYREIIIHLFGNNLQLKTVVITNYNHFGDNIENFSFLEGIINPSVENLELSLDLSQNADKTIAAFTNKL